MNQTIAIYYAISMLFIVGYSQLAYWVFHRGDKIAHRNLLAGIVLFFAGLLGLVLCGAYQNYCVDDDDANNDHGSGTNNDHVIINISKLLSVDPSILIRSIPVVDFNPGNFEDSLECVVCLSDLADGGKAKVLPSCKHWFHAHCIDTWLESQVTCPICRKRVHLFQINESSSGNRTCSDEHSADTTAVVVDIPASPEIEDLGPLHS